MKVAKDEDLSFCEKCVKGKTVKYVNVKVSWRNPFSSVCIVMCIVIVWLMSMCLTVTGKESWVIKLKRSISLGMIF